MTTSTFYVVQGRFGYSGEKFGDWEDLGEFQFLRNAEQSRDTLIQESQNPSAAPRVGYDEYRVVRRTMTEEVVDP